MKKITAILFSVTIALTMSSCQQMRSTKSKTAQANPTYPSPTYGSYQQTSPSYQGANPYAAANTGSANNSTYGQYQQSSALPLPQENDYVKVTPTTPQYNSTPQYNTTPQYQAASPSPQMGSYQDAANPLPLPTYDTASQPAQPSQGTFANTHTVQRGETLYRISKMYGSSVDGIKGVNALNSDIIHPGDILSIP